jgi:CheY-like chemotaxis protein
MSRPPRSLVVDDSEMNRKLLSRLLQSHGHVCVQANDGLEAFKLVRQSLDEFNPYDAILLDYEMTEMNGPTAARETRQLGCDSFLVGITGNILPEAVAHFKECGADGVLPKPFRHVGGAV